ncbi:uncharacterized protein PG998_011462 [Apiospora kogelbergensis]|uniref:uncharacterized protein n=1 Tax=Apiospora kogelbergensis TaxID=1337665 RepID=UPI003130F181
MGPNQNSHAVMSTREGDVVTEKLELSVSHASSTADAESAPTAPLPQRSGDEDKDMAARVRHRIDWRLIPALGLMYGISLMDRKNVSNAAIAGMLADLDMRHGVGYNVVNMSFFITYILLQPVMVIACRRLGPRLFLPAICVAWGAVIIGFGAITVDEVARRYSLFYGIGSFSSALSGILAYGLQQLEGNAGLRGWRWIFIIEGVMTCAIAIFSVFFLVRFPDQEKEKRSWRFLSEEQLTFLIGRLQEDRGDAESEAFTWKRFLQPATEWYIYVFPLILFLVTTVSYAFAFTLPIILRDNLGFSVAMSQCLGAPPYAASIFVMYGVNWYGDRKKQRGPILVFLSLVSLIGLPIMGFVENPWVKYFGVFVTISGTNSCIPSVMAYQANNIRGQWRRAFCSAALTGIGGIGGIAGAFMFRAQDQPRYLPGFLSCMVCNILVMVLVAGQTLYFRKKNRQADRGHCILLEDPNFRFTI